MRRPAILFFGSFALVMGLALTQMFDDPALGSRARPFVFMEAFLIAFVMSRVVGEAQQGAFFWMTPRLADRLRRGVLLTVILTAALSELVVRQFDPTLPFGMAAAIGVLGFGFGYAVIGPAARGSAQLKVVVGVVVLLSLPRLVVFGTEHPIAFVGLSVLLAAAMLVPALGRGAARRAVLVPTLVLADFTNPTGDTALVRHQRATSTRTGRWHGGQVGSSLRDWLSVAAFEHAGHSALGWRGFAAFAIAAPLAAAAIFLYVDLIYVETQSAPIATLGRLYDELLLAPEGIQRAFPDDISTAPFVTLFALMAAFQLSYAFPLAPLSGLPRPLSRRDRARLWFIGNGIGLAAVLGAITLIYAASVEGLARYLDLPGHGGYMPAYLRAILIIAAAAPMIQWLRLRVDAFGGGVGSWGAPTWLATLAQALTLMACFLLTMFWQRTAPGNMGFELALLVGAVATSQLLFYRAVQRECLYSDLA